MLEKSQWAKKDDLKKLQFKKLKALLKYAYESVPFYYESYKKADFRSDSLRRLEDLPRAPILEKAAFRSRSSEMLAMGYPRAKSVRWKTSGTTASPTRFLRCKSDLDWAVAAELRGFGWAGYEPARA